MLALSVSYSHLPLALCCIRPSVQRVQHYQPRLAVALQEFRQESFFCFLHTKQVLHHFPKQSAVSHIPPPRLSSHYCHITSHPSCLILSVDMVSAEPGNGPGTCRNAEVMIKGVVPLSTCKVSFLSLFSSSHCQPIDSKDKGFQASFSSLFAFSCWQWGLGFLPLFHGSSCYLMSPITSLDSGTTAGR